MAKKQIKRHEKRKRGYRIVVGVLAAALILTTLLAIVGQAIR